MRILVLASTFPRYPGDAMPEFVLELSTHIARHAKVWVLVPHDRRAKLVERMGAITVYRFPYFLPGLETLAYRGGMVNRFRSSWLAKVQLPFFLVAQFIACLGLVIGKRIDVIHAHWLFPQGLVAAAVKAVTNRRLIITTHGGDIAILQQKLAAWMLAPVVKIADRVTFVSAKNRNDAVRRFGPSLAGKSSLLPMGVYLQPPAATVAHARINVLFVGRLVAIKGVEVLIRSFRIAQAANPALFLDLVGDGPLRRQLEQLVHSLGLEQVVAFRGYLTGADKAKQFEAADLVVVPSIIDAHGHQEGLPVVALEALAFGKPVVATTTGSLPELINSSNGALVEPGNIDALAQAIVDLAASASRREALARAARQTAAEYSWERVTGQFLQLVEGVAHHG